MNSVGAMNGSMVGRMMEARMKTGTDPAERFASLDSDGGGTLDSVELSEEARKLSEMTGTTINAEEAIETYDADGDGELSQDEMMTMIGEVLGPPPGMEGVGTTESTMQEMGPMMPPGPPPEELFAEFDADSDAVLSTDELTAFAEDFAEKTGQTIDVEQSLADYDSDGDEALSQEEMDNMMTALREESFTTSSRNGFTSSGLSIQSALEAYILNASEGSISTDEETLALASDLLDRLTSEE